MPVPTSVNEQRLNTSIESIAAPLIPEIIPNTLSNVLDPEYKKNVIIPNIKKIKSNINAV